jgi:5-methylcytosine-specific restriction endonuclease McrA
MGKRKKKQKPSRPGGGRRLDLLVAVALTDVTFEPTTEGWIGRCIHCGRKIAVAKTGATSGTLEHIIPLSANGSPDDPKNLALACTTCNNEKGINVDPYVGRGGRADEVVATLLAKRTSRWRDV